MNFLVKEHEHLRSNSIILTVYSFFIDKKILTRHRMFHNSDHQLAPIQVVILLDHPMLLFQCCDWNHYCFRKKIQNSCDLLNEILVSIFSVSCFPIRWQQSFWSHQHHIVVSITLDWTWCSAQMTWNSEDEIFKKNGVGRNVYFLASFCFKNL